uniref:Uncharacterized protein n=1 Tax=viral metagenome TaxID=1070528 RepID=A0A6C0ESB5_9ZZZZ
MTLIDYSGNFFNSGYYGTNTLKNRMPVFTSPNTLPLGIMDSSETNNIVKQNYAVSCFDVSSVMYTSMQNSSHYWTYSNAISIIGSVTQKFWFNVENQPRNVNVQMINTHTQSNSEYYLDNNIYINDRDVINISSLPFPFSKLVSLVSQNYSSEINIQYYDQQSKVGQNSLTYYCNHTQTNHTINFLLTSTNSTAGNASLNPYEAVIILNDIVVYTSGSLAFNTYTIPTLQVGDKVEIVMRKVRDYGLDEQGNSTTNGSLITGLSTDNSVLFIDLKTILWNDPNLYLTLPNTDNYYSMSNLLNFSCNLNPTNVNNDNLDGQDVKLIIKDSNNTEVAVYSTSLVNNIASFVIPESDKSRFLPGNYSAIVSYDPFDSTNNVFNSTTSSNYPFTYHYNSGNSNVVNFTIKKQKIRVLYDTAKLSSSYSTLRYASLDGFYIEDFRTGTRVNVAGISTFKVVNPNNTTAYINTNVTNIQNISFLPSSNQIYPDTEYKINLSFVPTQSDIIETPDISPDYVFYTEKPIIKISELINRTPSYTSSNNISATIVDSSNNYYNSSTLPGSLDFVVSQADNSTINSAYSSSGNPHYIASFSPKTLNLLRYSSSNFTISASFLGSSGIPVLYNKEIHSNNDQLQSFVYTGVNVVSSISPSHATVYNSFTITSAVYDNTGGSALSISDLPVSIDYSFLGTNRFNKSTQNGSNNFIQSFVPKDYSLNSSNNPITVYTNLKTNDIFDSSKYSNTSVQLNIDLITPVLSNSTQSLSYDLYEDVSFNLTLTGYSGKNDNGTLKLYNNNSSEITSAKKNNFTTNTTNYTLSGVKMIDLLGSTELSIYMGSDIVNAFFEWNANSPYIYTENIQSMVNLTLKKTDLFFENVVIDNNNCIINDTIYVNGNVNSSYLESLSGTVYLVDPSNNNNVISSVRVDNNNSFSISFTSEVSRVYNLALVFTPDYENVYNSSSQYNVSLKFVEESINPVVQVINVDNSQIFDHNAILSYTNNFKIKISNLSNIIEGTTASLKILSGSNVVLSVDNLGIDENGIVLTDVLNMVESNTNKYNILNVFCDISLNLHNYDTDKYIIVYPSEQIEFTQNHSKPSFDSLTFTNSSNVLITNDTFYFNDTYNVLATFGLVNKDGSILPISGNLKVTIYDESGNLINNSLNKTLQINYETTQQITTFKPSSIPITRGNYTFKYEITPDDPNLQKFTTNILNITVVPTSIREVNLTTFPILNDVVLYGEDFSGIITFIAPTGCVGKMEVWCVDPNEGNDQRLSSVSFSNYGDSVLTELNFKCDAIGFDCPQDPTTYNLYVKFVSSTPFYGDNTYYVNSDNNEFTIDVYQTNIYLSELIFNDNLANITYTTDSLGKLVKTVVVDGNTTDYNLSANQINDAVRTVYIQIQDTLQISGYIKTLDNKAVNKGTIDLICKIWNNNQYSYVTILTTNVLSNGYFTTSNLVDVNSIIYKNEPAIVYLKYNGGNNFKDSVFDSDSFNPTNKYTYLSGNYIMRVDYNIADFTFAIKNSDLTNDTVYYFQEDVIEFDVSFNTNTTPYYKIQHGKIVVYLYKDNQYIGNIDGYSSGVNSNNTSIIRINPKAEDILPNTGYTAVAKFVCDKFQETYSSNIVSFSVIKTTPVISFVIKDPLGNTTTSVDYESNVNINVKVQSKYPIQQPSYNSQTRDINGTVVLRKKTIDSNSNDIYQDMTVSTTQYGVDISSVYIVFDQGLEGYDHFSASGTIVNFAPFGNSPEIIYTQDGITAVFDFNYFENNNDKYNAAIIDNNTNQHFTINKHSIDIEITDISVLYGGLDVNHSTPNSDNVDNSSIYYENNSATVRFNGVINYDEPFKIVTHISQKINGSLSYKYSVDNSNFVNLIPITPVSITSNTIDNNVIARFDAKTITVPTNNSNTYYVKVIFTPTSTNYYNTITSSPSSLLNMYEANVFGTGNLYYDSLNNSTVTKTILYKSDVTFDVYAKFAFDSNIPNNKRKCLVELYHDNYDPANKISTPTVYLTNSSSSYKFTLSGNVLPYKDGGYALKALFTPVTNTNDRNLDYPVVAKEFSPLSLNIKPYLTISGLSDNFTFNYSDSVSASITVHSGSLSVLPYNQFVVKTYGINGTEYNQTSTYNFSTSTIDQTIVLSRLDQLLSGSTNRDNSIEVGNYYFKIYARDSNDSNNLNKTNEITYYFTVTKKQIQLNVNMSTHYALYRDKLELTFSITNNYPINNGTISIVFTDDKTSEQFTKILDYNDSKFKQISQYTYKYKIDDLSQYLQNAFYVGSFKLYSELSNKNLLGSYSDDSNDLIINKSNNCRIVVDENMYNSNYLDIIPVNAQILYKHSDLITTASVSYIVNNGSVQQASLSGSYYSFNIDTTTLNKGINEVVVYFTDNNYSGLPTIFQVNVGKEINVLTNTLTYSSNDNDTFTLYLNNLSNGDSVTFYRSISITSLTPISSNNGYYRFNYSSINYGDNNIYAIIRSENYDVTSTSVDISRNRKDVTITFTSELSDTYKSGSLLDLYYQVLDSVSGNNVTEGTVEIHKVTVVGPYLDYILQDEILARSSVYNGFAYLQYTLTSDTNDDTYIKFYGVFKNSENFNNVSSSFTQPIHIYKKDNAFLSDDTMWESPYNFGDIIDLKYSVSKSQQSRNQLLSDEQIAAQKLSELNIASQNLANSLDAKNSAELALNNYQTNRELSDVTVDLADEILSDLRANLIHANNEYSEAVNKYNSIVLDMSNAEVALNNATVAAELSVTLNNLNGALAASSSANQSVIDASNAYAAANINRQTADSSYNTLSTLYVTDASMNDASMNLQIADASYALAHQAVLDASTNYINSLPIYNSALDDLAHKEEALFQQIYAEISNNSIGDINNLRSAYLSDASTNLQNAIQAYNDASNNLNSSYIDDNGNTRRINQNSCLNLSQYKSGFTFVQFPSNIFSGMNTITLEIWHKYQGTGVLFEKWKAFRVGIDSGYMRLTNHKVGYGTDDQTFVGGYTRMQLGEWHHIAVTINFGVTNGSFVYLDGVLVNPEGFTINLRNDSYPMLLGCILNYDNFNHYELQLPGGNSNMRLWSTIRSQTDIVNNMYTLIQTPTNNLVGSYYLNEGTGTVTYNKINSITNGALRFVDFYGNSQGEYPRDYPPTIWSYDSLPTYTNANNLNQLVGLQDAIDAARAVYNADLSDPSHVLILAQLLSPKSSNLISAIAEYLSGGTPIPQQLLSYEDIISTITSDVSNNIAINLNLLVSLISEKFTHVDSSLTSITGINSSYVVDLSNSLFAFNNALNNLNNLHIYEDLLASEASALNSKNSAQNTYNSYLFNYNLYNTKQLANQQYTDAGINLQNAILYANAIELLIKLYNDNNNNNTNIAQLLQSMITLYQGKLIDYSANVVEANAEVLDTQAQIVKYTNLYNLADASFVSLSNSYNTALQVYTTAAENYSSANNAYALAYNNLNTSNSNVNIDILNAAISEGIIEIHKYVYDNNNDSVIGYLKPDNTGEVLLSYRLIDVGQVNFYALFKNSINYYDASVEQDIYISNRIVTNIINVSELNTNDYYKLNQQITLSYNVKSNNRNLTNGIVEFHKYYDNGYSEEILGYSNLDSDGIASLNVVLTDIGYVYYYAVYKTSFDYSDSTSSDIELYVHEKYRSNNTLYISSTNVSYGETISLTSNITSCQQSTINEGVVEFYVKINGSEELIGYSDVINNNATLSYTVNDVDNNVRFYSIFKNSVNFFDAESNKIHTNIDKRTPDSIVITIPNTNNYLSISTITAQVNFPEVNDKSKQGTVTFTVTNNGDTHYTSVDLNDGVAELALLLESSSQYTIQARFNGNDNYSTLNSSSSYLTPTVVTNMYNLSYSTNSRVYATVTATLNLSNSSVSNAFILKNTGYVLFKQLFNGTIVNVVTEPLRNASATAVMRIDPSSGYTIAIEYQDKLNNPSIVLLYP